LATTAVSSALQVGGEDVMGSYASIYVDLSTVWIWTSLGSGEGQRETAPGETNRRSTVGEDGTALCCVQLHTCRLLVVGLQVFGCIDFGEQLRGEESKVYGSRHIIILREYSILLSAIVTFREFRSRNKVNNTEWSIRRT
jgi:hypothetical protein